MTGAGNIGVAAPLTGTPQVGASVLQPTLSDDVVLLRPLVAEDWESLFAVAADRELWALHPAHDRWHEPVFRTFFDAALASGGALVIVERASGAILGSSRFDETRAGPGEVEIGWTFLARRVWGGEVNRRIKRLMVAHALGLYERVVFHVGEDNFRSRRALEKIGAALTDARPVAEMAGRAVTHVVYSIDRANFAAGPLASV